MYFSMINIEMTTQLHQLLKKYFKKGKKAKKHKKGG